MEIIRRKQGRTVHSYIPELGELYRQGRVSRREFLRTATLLGMSVTGATAFLAACAPTPGGAPAPTAESLAVGANTPVSEPTAAPSSTAPKRGGTIRSAMEVMRIDHPARYSWVRDANLTRNVLDYLAITGGDNITRPFLLEKWETSEDLLTWELYLRQDATWNNGDKFTAEDVLFSMNEWLNPDVGSSMKGLMDYLQPTGIERVDDYHIRLHLDKPNLAVPEHLFHYPAQILHRDFGGDIVAQPVGTGPFLLQEYAAGERCVLKRRPDYWRNGADGQALPYLDEIVYIDMGSDQTSSVTAFKNGQIDTIYQPTPPTWQALKDLPGVMTYSVPTAECKVLKMRVDKEPFNDERVRMALKLCQNRQRILDLSYYGEGTIAQDCHVAPAHPDYAEIPTLPYDPEKAKALLAEAGYPDGLTISINYGSGYVDSPAIAETLKADAAPAGFNIELNPMPNDQYWDIWTECDLGLTSWTHRPLGVMVLSLAYTCDAEGNPVAWNETRWCDAEFDELLQTANATLDVEKRREIMKKLELIQQERGSIGLAYFANAFRITAKTVKNYEPHPAPYDLWNELWLDTEA